MPKTIQVVRIDDDIETQVGGGRMQFWHEDKQRRFDLGVVIELTEKRAMIGWENRRWVSGWKTANE